MRSRNAEIVQLLLDKKAKVSATDKKGDTVLHIAMRARSKAIVEILLRNPKNSQLLYRPNRQGETPYNIDVNHPKTMLGQIFGARKLIRRMPLFVTLFVTLLITQFTICEHTLNALIHFIK